MDQTGAEKKKSLSHEKFYFVVFEFSYLSLLLLFVFQFEVSL